MVERSRSVKNTMSSIGMKGCRIFAAEDTATFVDQAIEDLAEATGGIRSSLEEVGGIETNVLVGKKTVREMVERFPALASIGLDGLSDQGFLLKTIRANGNDLVICAGGGPRGDAYAVIELVKALRTSAEGLVFLDETERREEPFFIRRGIYAHQHWAYNYPYALRSWKFEDWRRYIDLLAYLKINFFQIWSMVGILPIPLSAGDREYLENYRRVIDYAKNRRGMEVFIGECANNVAESDGGVPIQQRDYFEVEVLKDPSDPKQFQEIMDNRRNLYEIASNADGYWIIDSDPGGFEGSPPSEFVDILIGNRRLIDECTEKGPNAKLAYWMWMSWGKGKPRDEREVIPRITVEDMRERLKEPWWLLTCWPNHLDASRDLGYIDKSIFFPYGTIEDEPSPPTTRLRFDEMYFHLNNAMSIWGLRNVMGNAQTPLVQLPNIFFFAESAWHGLPPSLPKDSEVCARLAYLIAPDIADDLTEGWLALKHPSAEEALLRANRLETIVREKRIGRLGALGRLYFPGVERLLLDLAAQLKVHAGARTVCNALEKSTSPTQVEEALLSYYEAALTWQATHGFNRYYLYGPDVQEMGRAWTDYVERIASARELSDRIRRRLIEKGYAQAAIDGFMTLTTSK